MIRRIEWAILGVILLVLFGFTLNWAIKGAIHYQKDVLVPDLIGKPLTDALEILSQQNLGLKK